MVHTAILGRTFDRPIINLGFSGNGQARPETPILLVEDRTYTNAFLIPQKQERNDTSRAAFEAAYERLQKAGVKHLHYLEGEKLLGADGEDTVDSSHPTDLGFMRQAKAFEKVLRPLLTK
jgi:hypothetical protein